MFKCHVKSGRYFLVYVENAVWISWLLPSGFSCNFFPCHMMTENLVENIANVCTIIGFDWMNLLNNLIFFNYYRIALSFHFSVLMKETVFIYEIYFPHKIHFLHNWYFSGLLQSPLALTCKQIRSNMIPKYWTSLLGRKTKLRLSLYAVVLGKSSISSTTKQVEDKQRHRLVL